MAKQKVQQLTPEEMMEMALLEEELYLLKKEHGLLKEKKGIFKFIDRYFHGDAEVAVEQEVIEKEPCIVNRKKYLWFLLLTGWCGGHMFYAKKYKTAILYLVFFWTGFPLAMAIVDWLIWLPKKPDAEGNIEL